MAGLLGFDIGDIAAAVDARKRYYANLIGGLLSDPANTIAQLRARDSENARANRQGLGGLQSVMPEVRDQAAQQSVQQALNMGGLLGITVYHGSPHKFAPTPNNPLGEFDATKIGTGEGAQAYGHGVYFAERPGVAKSYAETLADRQDPRGEINALFFTAKSRDELTKAVAANPVLGPLVKQEPQYLKDILEYHAGQNADGTVTDAALRAAKRLDANLPKAKGNFYTVDLPDEWLPKMLDWDKPLSQQPEAVREAIKNAPFESGGGDWTGRQLLDAAQSYAGATGRSIDANPAAGSDLLRSIGIPGIRYLDGGSRAAGQGTSNYVVFPGMEQYLKILGIE